jgi:hypothetical protein
VNNPTHHVVERRSPLPDRRAPVQISKTGIYYLLAGLYLSGALWLLFHYFLMISGPFGSTPRPLEPWWLRLHGAFAFVATWTLGLLWGIHIVRWWQVGRRRGSGGPLVGIFGFLVVTGYLLYYAGDDLTRNVISTAHWILGLGAAPVAFWFHQRNLPARHR